MRRGAVAAVAGRGGLLRPTACGTYLVDDVMVEELERAERGEHAANLGAVMALEFAREVGVNAYVVDPVTADEWQDCARFSGSHLVPRSCVGHVLNSKAVARRYSRGRGRDYASMRLVVVHMGNGITVSAHRDGLMIDCNTIEEGPFGPDRTGSLPARELIKLCFSGRYTQAELDRHVFGDGGLFAYLGTRDPMEVEQRIEARRQAGRDGAGRDALSDCQRSRRHGGCAPGQGGCRSADRQHGLLAADRQQALHLSGVDRAGRELSRRRRFEALAEGVFRVLDGEEEAKRLPAE